MAQNVTKQTNPLQVNNFITGKSVGIYGASRRILITQCVKIYSCKCEIFLKTL